MFAWHDSLIMACCTHRLSFPHAIDCIIDNHAVGGRCFRVLNNPFLQLSSCQFWSQLKHAAQLCVCMDEVVSIYQHDGSLPWLVLLWFSQKLGQFLLFLFLFLLEPDFFLLDQLRVLGGFPKLSTLQWCLGLRCTVDAYNSEARFEFGLRHVKVCMYLGDSRDLKELISRRWRYLGRLFFTLQRGEHVEVAPSYAAFHRRLLNVEGFLTLEPGPKA